MAKSGRVSVVLALGVVTAGVLASGGCRTWMRGAGYKRLISSYAESVSLADMTAERLEAERAAGAGDERLAKIEDLHEDVVALRDRWHDSLDLRRREGWNRTRTNQLWGRYLELFPDEKMTRWEFVDQRRIEVDEIRSRRTPLTHDHRIRFAPTPKDGFTNEGESWQRKFGVVSPTGDVPAAERAAPRGEGSFFTPAPQPRPQIEPYLPPVDNGGTPTDSLLRELLEDQAETKKSGG